ncbi:glutathione S-transferase [Streptomyces viridochromogenes]|uniref:Glutathione S-transferase n=1 Tax=Streptomyces viridochromogenes TaxID=1938 RepID=A0A0J8CE97_STRVR|nr:glutathione S-transferase C-terminal domain-containing protein [Streptomyces viridochromogenes]KMS76280.1 glutathione S-transferase [Streptomyces viridochromogenes]KOG20392.1 glutathione S-transferase [Streptomyces viridochromogenes]KOG22234.1 glutathione S-transferase [Streptomyces viridochromogenes]
MSAPAPSAVPSFRSRIGCDPRSGYYAAPRRYRLHLSLSCPHCLRIAVTHSLLGLGDILPVTLLPAVPDAPDGGHPELRPLYEASSHQHPGPAVAPVLSDAWTGTIVSTHAPDILRDLARRFGGRGPDLFPRGAEAAVEGIGRLCERDITEAAQRAGRPDGDPAARESALATLTHALDALELRLAAQEYVLGAEPTLADVELWVALVQLDTVHRHHLDAAAVTRVTDHPQVWAYARRLAAHPAFGAHLDLDGIARRHHAHCRGEEAAGAAVQIVDWAAYARDVSRPASPTPTRACRSRS